MASTILSLVTIARRHLLEDTEKFWLDQELCDLMNLGVRDLWRSIDRLGGQHFWTLNITAVSQDNGAVVLTGTPADVARVLHIELRTPSSVPGMRYEPRAYGHPDFVTARTAVAAAPTSGAYYYALVTQGAPIAAPTIAVAPKVNSQVLLALAYVPTIAALTLASSNPIPGESDNALVAFCVAYARAKERQDRAPDSGWLDVYAAEKGNVLEALRSRQGQFGFIETPPLTKE